MNSVINGSGKFIGLLLFLLSTLALASCGSSTGNQTIGPPFVMSISPGNQTVMAGTTIHFVAIVNGTAQTVTWTAATTTLGASAGTIDALGVYTAPGVTASTTVTVTATSTADPTRSISTTLTVIPLPPFPSFSRFSTSGKMPVARGGHTATLLPSGLVLVAGGTAGATFFNNAEIYNPTVTPPTYAATGAMGTGRAHHTATVLANGLVLITGGFHTYTTVINSAELYNPANGLFSATGVMSAKRADHTATLLSNGKVLIAGGSSTAAGTAVNTAELYDPVTGTFIPLKTNNMKVLRKLHTATLLNNGKVLIAGGINAAGVTESSVEFFFINQDPQNFGNFSATTSMSSARAQHTATLRNGSVLMSGGRNDTDPIVMAYERYTSGGLNVFIASGSMSIPRYDHTASLLPNGQVLVIGGISTGDVATSSTEFYPAFTSFSSLRTPRALHTATPLYNGTLLITGGVNAVGPVQTFEIAK